ncbi:FecR domain-containing protein [Bordetella sp. BOR01]|uniref:FecR domain-containing protein n=1 Tax=Bordetella sp. BOR01 TaxID=2854779 RepID=UPI001C482CB6|nr:FecR domain-containing protein [Bordetella sp. BOR01]MBV7481612.1 FecR domain-containing protein [Bordetella sp. BOR01]
MNGSHVAPPLAAGRERLAGEVVDAAIAWSIKLAGPQASPRMRQAFAAWLDENPQHAVAWQRVVQVRGDLGGLPPALALNTLNAAQALHDERKRGHRLQRRAVLGALSCGGILLGAGWTTYRYAPWQRMTADFSTGVGERRRWQLADGTLLELNTDSAANATLSGEQRWIRVTRGEIMITTGADTGAGARRPFWVQTSVGRLQALGTRFVVRLEAGQVRVSVQEGAVALHPDSGATGGVVNAGESRWMSAARDAPAPSPGFAADAWTRDVVAGNDLRLADLLRELQRYQHGHIWCDEQVAGLRVSGVFHTNDVDKALETLALTQPIAIARYTRLLTIVRSKPG